MKELYFTLISLFMLSNTPLQSQDLEDLSFGEDSSLDIATWNIEWFPKNGQITVEYVTQIIEQLDLDILAIQEVDDRDMFDQVLGALPSYTGYYESDWFAGLAYIYKTEVIEINEIYEIYTTSPYWSAFPRSPMVMDMNFMGENYFLINNHYKCCGDGILDFNDESDEEKRRYNANNLLKEYIETFLLDENVMVLGDLNDDIAEAPQNNVFQMFLDDTDNYLFVDLEIANGAISEWSYPSWPSHLDHILITNELFDELDNSDIQTIKIDEYLDGGWNEYDQNISDHRPVAIKFSFDTNLSGDINGDGILNIQDIILITTIVLDGDYTVLADMNGDGTVNILDVVLLVFIILNLEP